MNVLIVDDSNFIRKVLRNNLMRLDLPSSSIHEAIDGMQAWSKMSGIKQTDLIITDLIMPNMDGIEFIRNLKKSEKYKETVVLVISSALTRERRELLDSMGVYGYVMKPFDCRKFMEIVEPVVMGIGQQGMHWVNSYDGTVTDISERDLTKLIQHGVKTSKSKRMNSSLISVSPNWKLTWT